MHNNHNSKQIAGVRKDLNVLISLFGEQLAKSNELIHLTRKIVKQTMQHDGGKS